MEWIGNNWDLIYILGLLNISPLLTFIIWVHSWTDDIVGEIQVFCLKGEKKKGKTAIKHWEERKCLYECNRHKRKWRKVKNYHRAGRTPAKEPSAASHSWKEKWKRCKQLFWKHEISLLSFHPSLSEQLQYAKFRGISKYAEEKNSAGSAYKKLSRGSVPL